VRSILIISGLECRSSTPHDRSFRMSRLLAFIRHHLAGSGMLVALLLLCAFFSIVTWTEQHPQDAAAAKQLATQITPNAKVLIVVRPQAEDIAFAEALNAALDSRGEIVKGEPKDARAALQRAATSGGLDVIACNHATASWLVFSDLATDFPALKDTRVLKPQSQAWPVFLKADNLLNIANQIAVIAILAIGMTLVIITGGIDLSVGSLIALSAVVTAMIVRDCFDGTNAERAGNVHGGSWRHRLMRCVRFDLRRIHHTPAHAALHRHTGNDARVQRSRVSSGGESICLSGA
jgi:ribose transport system permease protein